MIELVFLVCGSVLGAITWWGAIRVLDRYNTRNRPWTALAVCLAATLFSQVGGILLGIPTLVGLVWLLLRYYDVGVLRTILVLVLNVAFSIVAGMLLVAMLGGHLDQGSWRSAGALVLVTAVAAVIWLRATGALGGGRRSDADRLPRARLERSWRPAGRKAARAKPAAPSPAPKPDAMPAPPVEDPAPASPPVEPGGDPDGPRFLR